jgi:hypothetical protein
MWFSLTDHGNASRTALVPSLQDMSKTQKEEKEEDEILDENHILKLFSETNLDAGSSRLLWLLWLLLLLLLRVGLLHCLDQRRQNGLDHGLLDCLHQGRRGGLLDQRLSDCLGALELVLKSLDICLLGLQLRLEIHCKALPNVSS